MFGQTAPVIDHAGIEKDRGALIALYNATTDGYTWSNKTNWLSDKPLNEWFGVTTNAQGRVVQLDLENNQLSGSIPTELGNLKYLTYLALEENQLWGFCPPSI